MSMLNATTMPQTKAFNVGSVFVGKPGRMSVNGWDAPWDYTPAIDQSFRVPAWARDIIAWIADPHEALYLFGPTGCGKTTALKQLVARLNWPVYEVTGHSRLEFPELVGHNTIVKGNMVYQDGPLTLAMRHGGLFLLNEADLLDPATAAGLNSVLDGSPLCIAENGGELVKPHPLFRFAATANSSGTGDSSGMYQGILRQNMALMDRFLLVQADYLDADLEEALVAAEAPGLPDTVVKAMVATANAVRKQFVGAVDDATVDTEPLDITMSTRTLRRWARLTASCKPLARKGIDPLYYALDRALLFRAEPTTRAAVKEIVQRIFGERNGI